MVFGWGKKNRAQVQKTEETVERSVAISDVSQIVTDTLKIHSKTIVSETSSLHSRMDNLFADLAKIISKLDGDDLKIGDVDRNIRVIVERGKKQVIKIIKEESERPLQKISKPEDIEKFVADAKRRIKRTGDALGRHSRVINLFAKKYAIRIKDIMKNLESVYSHLQHLLFDEFWILTFYPDRLSLLIPQVLQMHYHFAQHYLRII